MNWKQFLKPDWRKIAIFAVFIILFLFTEKLVKESILYYFSNQCLGGPCDGCMGNVCTFGSIKIYFYNNFEIKLLPLVILDPFRLFLDYRFFIPWNYEDNSTFSLGYIIYPITIFYSYLLSCLIVWVYDKFRKKK